MAKIRVGIVGVGNCASSLVQGVFYYRDATEDDFIPGLMHPVLGGYRIKDIEFSAAFDIDANKVGKDLSEAIFTEPNCTMKFSDVPSLGVEVMKGPVLDGLGRYLKGVIKVNDDQKPVDVSQVLKETKTDVLVNFVPVGAERAAKFYAEQALEAGTAYINAMPVFIASNPDYQRRFEEKKVPIIGDDVKSQVGATIVHRSLVKLLVERGVKIEKTYQLNVGGNTDFLNMLERERLKSKEISKTEAVKSLIPYEVPMHIGPSDYVEFLGDNKVAYIRIEGRKFGDAPIIIELRLSVIDSPNSAGVVIDAIRCAKIALDRGIGGPLYSASAYFMKHPPKQYPDPEARKMLEEFIEGKRDR